MRIKSAPRGAGRRGESLGLGMDERGGDGPPVSRSTGGGSASYSAPQRGHRTGSAGRTEPQYGQRKVAAGGGGAVGPPNPP
jgi:hypothetical protein